MSRGLDTPRSTHQIRLRGPCRLLWLRNGTQQAEVRVQIPGEIQPDLFETPSGDDGGTFFLRRRFGKPSRLDESQNVTLELSGFQNAASVAVNRGSDNEIVHAFENEEQSVSFSLTECLLQNNTLEVEFRSLPAFAGDIRIVIQQVD